MLNFAHKHSRSSDLRATDPYRIQLLESTESSSLVCGICCSGCCCCCRSFLSISPVSLSSEHDDYAFCLFLNSKRIVRDNFVFSFYFHHVLFLVLLFRKKNKFHQVRCSRKLLPERDREREKPAAELI